VDWLAPFDYELPDDRIARRPAEPRDSSRLLVLDRGAGRRTQAVFHDLPRFLRPGDLLVPNETRVLRARLRTRLARTGRAVEVLLSHPAEGGWLAMLGPSRRLRPGDRLQVETIGSPGGARTSGDGLTLVKPAGSGFWLVRAEGSDLEAMMEEAGHVPIPPYLGREDLPDDRSWYQTVFAREDGAVAAPTAGLHFTPGLLASLQAMGVELARVVLHVGPGTFLPVRSGSMEGHRVLPERFCVPEETAIAARRARARGGRVIAVGTTAARALESTWGETGSGWTGLTILPGHRFRVVDALVTNFHLPRSSLLLLVAAFAGREEILAAYAEAREAGFRFYSYGDAMLIL
jgi:S-adenosylmethionine:tRNA ribosyltransferase-isomerase